MRKSSNSRLIYFNGVEGESGHYRQPPISLDEFARRTRHWNRPGLASRRLPKADVDPTDLASAGWGVIFAEDLDPAIRRALKPLLEHRRRQATGQADHLFQELTYTRGFDKLRMLRQYGAGPGPVDPTKVPYYLLLVGNPRQIPFDLQYQLDTSYAVGRLDFPTAADFHLYAQQLVDNENRSHPSKARLACFGTENPDDPATRLSAHRFLAPLADQLRRDRQQWQVDTLLSQAATKDRLLQLLTGGEAPNLLFTASHAVAFAAGHGDQAARQGALLCTDWPLSNGDARIPLQHFLAAEDLPLETDLGGMISLLFACYSAGTPQFDAFEAGPDGQRQTAAPNPFVAALPQRLLLAGAAAVIGHVDVAWEHSFLWQQAGPQLQTYESTLKKLMDGLPVGLAMEDFGSRHAELAADLLGADLEASEGGAKLDDLDQAHLWTAYRDARSFIVLGDPAARIRV